MLSAIVVVLKSHDSPPCYIFLFSNKMMVIKAENKKKMFVIIANREEPDQTASAEAV